MISRVTKTKVDFPGPVFLPRLIEVTLNHTLDQNFSIFSNKYCSICSSSISTGSILTDFDKFEHFTLNSSIDYRINSKFSWEMWQKFISLIVTAAYQSNQKTIKYVSPRALFIVLANQKVSVAVFRFPIRGSTIYTITTWNDIEKTDISGRILVLCWALAPSQLVTVLTTTV